MGGAASTGASIGKRGSIGVADGEAIVDGKGNG